MQKQIAALLALGLITIAPAAAQTYPSRTITIVSPAPAGGVTDIIGRALALHFSKVWGQQAVVENKPGANNQVAAEYIMNSPPDGHTSSSLRIQRLSPIRACSRSCPTIRTRASRRSAG
jgi:tripartite-type tricarboxylate transporter receptor subunit TctC